MQGVSWCKKCRFLYLTSVTFIIQFMPFVVMIYANSKQTHKATEADGEMHSKLGLRYDVLILPINIHTPPRDSQGSSVWLSWKSHAITWCIATSVSASASMPGAATNTAKPDHLHFSNLKCGWTKAKANVLCSFMWCCHFLLFLLILFFFFFKLHCSKHWWPAQALIGANESWFQSCYNLLFLPTSAMKTQGYISP